MTHPREWMSVRPEGLYCAPADLYIDPTRAVERALITHGHADHARRGHGTVFATPATLDIMDVRYGTECCEARIPLQYGQIMQLGNVSLSLVPAGHILGSAQAVLEHEDGRIVISGDFKRREDPTCPAFQPVPCDVFVTEATFGLPVFDHPPIEHELQKLLHSVTLFPESCHLIGAYALGKAQRLMVELRRMGYEKPFYLHGAMQKLCDLYVQHGFNFGEVILISEMDKKTVSSQLAGQIVIAPPSAINDRWSRRLPEVITCLASGWMQIRARAKQMLVELPLIISDHADWKELLQTIRDVGAPEVWVTHGREEALVYIATQMGVKAQALSLLGYDDNEDE